MGGQPYELIPVPHVLQAEGLQIGEHRLSASCGVVERPDALITIVVMTLLFFTDIKLFIGGHFGSHMTNLSLLFTAKISRSMIKLIFYSSATRSCHGNALSWFPILRAILINFHAFKKN